MAIVLLSILLWTICFSVLARALAIALRANPLTRNTAIAWGLLILAAAGVLFRPHEDLFGGQDQGAYANAAAAYASNRQLSFTDPLLSDVDPDHRSEFYYGEDKWFRGVSHSKSGCLRIVEKNDSVELAPWFQPAYSIMMGSVTWLLPAKAMLYVSPLFGILTGLVLAVLAGTLFPRPGVAAAAFVFYILNPNTVWHARSVRPEMATGFLILGALVLVCAAWRGRSGRALLDLILAGAATALAVFTHVVAAPAALMLCLLALVLLWRGFTRFIAFIYVGLIGGVIFIWQNVVVADGYGLGAFVTPFLGHGLTILVVIVIATGLVAFAGRRRAEQPTAAPAAHTWVHHLPGAVLVLALTAMFYLIGAGHIEAGKHLPLPGALGYNARATDIRAIVHVISPWIALAALAGFALALLRRGPTRSERWAVIMTMLPAMLLLDEMHYLMYFSRRAQTFFIPAIALSLAALVALLPQRKGSRLAAAAPAAAILIVAAAGLIGRLHLVTGTEAAGFVRFTAQYAKEIRAKNGILLCDYSRLAAPFDYYFNIPTLGIDSNSRLTYGPAEKAWHEIMQKHPDRPAYFMTPAQTPLSNRFRFDPVRLETLAYQELLGRPDLPTGFRPRELDVSLYRMRLPRPGEREFSDEDFPLELPLGLSGMGLRGFGPVRSKTWNIKGIACEAGQQIDVNLPRAPDGAKPAMLRAFARVESASAELPDVSLGTQASSQHHWTRLGEHWALLHVTLPASEGPDRVTFSCETAFMLSDVHLVAGNKAEVIRLRQHGSMPRSHAPVSMDGRWAYPISQTLAPNGGKTGALVLVYARPGAEGQTITFTCSETKNRTVYRDVEHRWQWFAYSTGPVFAKRDRAWIRIETDPAYEPAMDGWPKHLGLLIGRVFVASAP